jgi:hypothetical protein
MHQESRTDDRQVGCRWLRPLTPGKIIFLVICVLLVFYFILLLIMPAVQVRRLNQQYGMEQDKGAPKAVINNDSSIFDLQKRKIFLDSRLKMVRSDSIGMAINLRDSTVTLEINGIILHRTKIDSYHASKIFRAVRQETYLGMFADPLRISSHQATIEKIPLIYRKAPKDSIEAAEYLAEVPDTTLKKPPLMLLTSDHDILLYFCPAEELSFHDKLIRLAFSTMHELRLHGHYLSSLFHLKMPAYHPGIKICITGREIIALYRALPENAMIALKL